MEQQNFGLDAQLKAQNDFELAQKQREEMVKDLRLKKEAARARKEPTDSDEFDESKLPSVNDIIKENQRLYSVS